jgi:hypothetical protein
MLQNKFIFRKAYFIKLLNLFQSSKLHLHILRIQNKTWSFFNISKQVYTTDNQKVHMLF